MQQLIMDTSGGNIACCYCGNHTVKSFHYDLMKINRDKNIVLLF